MTEFGDQRHKNYPDPEFIVLDGNTMTGRNHPSWDTLRWKTGSEYSFALKKQFNRQAQLRFWCEQNCRSVVVYIDTKSNIDSDSIYFFLVEDAAAFKLVWDSDFSI